METQLHRGFLNTYPECFNVATFLSALVNYLKNLFRKSTPVEGEVGLRINSNLNHTGDKIVLFFESGYFFIPLSVG